MPDHDSFIDEDAPFLLGLIGAILVAQTLGLVLARLAMGLAPVPFTMLAGFWLVSLTCACGFIAGLAGREVQRRWHPIVMVAVMAAPLLLPWFMSRIMPGPVWPAVAFMILLAGLGLSLVLLGRLGMRRDRIRSGIRTGAIIGVVLLIWNTLGSVHTPFLYDYASYGVQHKDTMFHAAIAQMLGNFGVQAIGVDALETTAYHTLSHKVIWGISAMTGAPVLQGYMLFASLTGGPLLAFFALAVGLRSSRLIVPDPALDRSLGVLAALALFAIFDIRSFLASESYQVSLMFFLVFLFLCFESFARREGGMAEVAVLLVAIAALIWLASQSKISTGAVMAPMAMTFFVVFDRFRMRSLVIPPVIFAAIVIVVLRAQALSDLVGESLIAPFHYATQYRSIAQPQLLLIIVALFALWRVRDRVMQSWPLFLVLIAGTGAGMTAANLVKLSAGSAYYFASPGMWAMTFVFSACLCAGFVATPRWRRVAAGVLALAFVADNSENLAKFRRDVERYEGAVAAQGEVPVLERMRRALDAGAAERSDDLAVFVPPSLDEYWDLTEIEPRKNQCWTIGFYLPAYIGLPVLTGLPEVARGCEVSADYGLSRHDAARAADALGDDKALCRLAVEKGIGTVLVMEGPDQSRRVSCGQ